MRLRAPEFISPPALPVLMLPYLAPGDLQNVPDLIPDQRGKDVLDVMPIGADLEIVAARRALMAFARLRQEAPSISSVRHIQMATAEAFKVDLWVILGRSRRQGIVRIRQIAMLLAHRVCHASREDVSRRFDRNHSTVHYAEKKFAGLLDGATSRIGRA
jgi:hypothetical protein